MEHSGISGKKFRTAFVLILVVAVSALFLAVTWPFLKPLLLGALLAGLFRPLYQWVTRRLGDRRSLGAVVTLLILFILVVGPISAFLGVVVQQALNISDQAIPWVRQHLGTASTFLMHTIGWCRNFQRSPIMFRVRRSLCRMWARRPRARVRCL